MKKLDPKVCIVESRRQAGGRNGGLQGGQRVRHEMFEEVARSQKPPLVVASDSNAASLIARYDFLDERKVELRDESPAAVPTLHSNSVSHHCRWRPVLPALLPA